MPLPDRRNVIISWSAFSGADTYRIERKLIEESTYVLVDEVDISESPYTDWSVWYGEYDYRMTALDGVVVLAQKVKQVTVEEDLEMPGPPSLWFDIVDYSAYSLDWDKDDADNWALNEWRQRPWTIGDPALSRWTASSAHAPALNIGLGNDEYFGTGYPVLFFGNSSTVSEDVPDEYMTLIDPPSAFEPPCSVLMSVNRTYTNNNDPRCLLQLGKLALYSSTGAGRFLGLRVAGGAFVSSSLVIASTLYLVAVIARSETDIDFHRINPGTNFWASDLGVSGAAWENHGEFSLGSMLTAPYHRNRFLTAGFLAWNKALTLLELKQAVNVVVNNNNLHYGG